MNPSGAKNKELQKGGWRDREDKGKRTDSRYQQPFMNQKIVHTGREGENGDSDGDSENHGHIRCV